MEKENNEEATSRQAQLKKMTEEALTTLSESLERGKSDDLLRYLGVMARFPKYSFRNLLLILMQQPEATRVMGFQSWKQLGRFVKKDEKAIRIWAPMKGQRNGDRDARSESQEESENRPERSIMFRPVCVFDVSQTEGEPLPKLSQVSGEPGECLEKLKSFASNRGIKLGYEKELRAYGLSRCGEIVLRLGLAPAFEFHVLAHEIAHELIHAKEDRKELTTRQGETEAEAVAYVVSRSIGLVTGNSSSDYIQLWRGDKETLSESLKKIQQTASQITQALLS